MQHWRHFPDGVAAALSAARAALAAASDEQQKVAAELASLESTIAAKNARIEAAVSDARVTAEHARDCSRGCTSGANEGHRRARIAGRSTRGTAKSCATPRISPRPRTGCGKRSDRHAAVPVPERMVTEDEVTAARNAKASARADLEGIEREIQRTHGALEQVGGAVARERLRDAIEAFELAERQEREIEAEYEAWLLLLEQMKEADAAQASNLGQALAPAIAGRFEALTQRRYENVRLTAQLGTEGVVVAGAVRSTERISVGTREQLSTLYRLSLAEYLKHDRRPRRSARPERRHADGLVSRPAGREGAQLSDRRVHMPARRLPGGQRDGAEREGRSQGHRRRVRTSGRPAAGDGPTVDLRVDTNTSSPRFQCASRFRARGIDVGRWSSVSDPSIGMASSRPAAPNPARRHPRAAEPRLDWRPPER